MLDNVRKWLNSNDNIFLKHGCSFEILNSPEGAEVESITVDFDFNAYFCRLIFWDTWQGHIEVLEIESEETFIDCSFNVDEVMSSQDPFKDIYVKLNDPY